MDRKDFLKACGVAIAGTSAVPLLARIPKGAPGRPAKDLSLWQFYGTGDGKIYSRQRPEDAWTLHADFGSECGIDVIYRSGTDILADVESKTGKFTLRLSADGRHWLSTGH